RDADADGHSGRNAQAHPEADAQAHPEADAAADTQADGCADAAADPGADAASNASSDASAIGSARHHRQPDANAARHHRRLNLALAARLTDPPTPAPLSPTGTPPNGQDWLRELQRFI